MRGKKVCLAHGWRSTGSRTAAVRVKCAKAKTVNGWETRAKRAARADGLKELREIDFVMKSTGMIAENVTECILGICRQLSKALNADLPVCILM